LLHAYDRLQELEPAIASEVRQLIGWNVSQEELEREGERLEDTWIVAGQWIDDQDRLLARRSWVVGRQTGCIGLKSRFRRRRRWCASSTTSTSRLMPT
jgi:hypothetical protein